jgi:telomerase reverse transcriptase
MIWKSTPISGVSAFCCAVLSTIIPNGFWGSGPDQNHNKRIFLAKVDEFVRLNRFEKFSLHEFFQGMKVRPECLPS